MVASNSISSLEDRDSHLAKKTMMRGCDSRTLGRDFKISVLMYQNALDECKPYFFHQLSSGLNNWKDNPSCESKALSKRGVFSLADCQAVAPRSGGEMLIAD